MEYSSASSAVSVDTVTSLPQVLGSVDKIEATQNAKQRSCSQKHKQMQVFSSLMNSRRYYL